MKRTQFLKHLREHDCELLREGGSHTLYVNPANRKLSAVPGHNEINDYLARKICRDLGIPDVSKT